MPISDYSQISPILSQIVSLKPKSILDVGCGLGIYGALCRVYLEGENLYDRANVTWNKKENWKTKIDCIEGFQKYITDLHKLVYNEIFISDAVKAVENFPDNTYDLVMAIDIIEHLKKEDGVSFIKTLKRIAKNVIIATPSKLVEQVVIENPLENHLSFWQKEDLQSLSFDILTDDSSLIGLYRDLEVKTPPALSRDFMIRLYRNGDEHGIIKLFKEIFGREMSLEEWRWKYTGKDFLKVYCSLAVNENNEVIAHYGGMPQYMVHKGKEIYGMAIGDVMVHPKYRGTKLFKKISELLPVISAQDGFILGYGFPNERAMKLPEKLGIYEKVEDVYESTKEVRFASNHLRFIYKLFPLSYDDNRIDILWGTLKDSIKISLIRDRKYLRWRYQKHPLFNYELWGIKKRWQQELSGFAVIRKDGENLLLIDFLCPIGQLAALVQKIENYAASSGFKKLKLWHPGYLNEKLEQLGFNVSKSGTCIPRTTHPEWLTKAEVEGKFFYTMGDTDFM